MVIMNSSTSNLNFRNEVRDTKAAILRKIGQPLSLEKISLPKELLRGQVLVKLIYSGICGAQLNEISGAKGKDNYLPHLLGHEGFCEVIGIGPDVSSIGIGDKAVMHWRPNVGIQSEVPRYSIGNENINAGWVTTFNEHAIVSENRLTKLKDDAIFSKEIIPLLGCALTTAFGVVMRETNVQSHDNVVIFGAGGVGLSIISLLVSMGVKNICIVDINSKKIEIARKLGANLSFDSSKFDSADELKKNILTEFNQKINFVYETSGNSAAINMAYELGSSISTILLIGVPFHDQKISINTLKLHFGMKFFGTEGGKSIPSEDIPKIISLMKENKLNLQSFPLNLYPFNDINRAIDDLKNGIPGRFILEF